MRFHVHFIQPLLPPPLLAGRLGAPPLLDPEDVWDIDTPERRSMITYFGVLYKAFGPK